MCCLFAVDIKLGGTQVVIERNYCFCVRLWFWLSEYNDWSTDVADTAPRATRVVVVLIVIVKIIVQNGNGQ